MSTTTPGGSSPAPPLPAACHALFCDGSCEDPAHAGPAEPRHEAELDQLGAMEEAMEAYSAKLRADPKERAKVRKLYRDALKASGKDAKEAAAIARDLVDGDRDGWF